MDQSSFYILDEIVDLRKFQDWDPRAVKDSAITVDFFGEPGIGMRAITKGRKGVFINEYEVLEIKPLKSAKIILRLTGGNDLIYNFDVNRNLLTKDFKTLPSNFNKYKSGSNVDNVSLTNVTSVSNNYFLFNNNYNFYQDNSENKFIAHVDFFPLKNQATLHEYYSENNHYNYEANTNNRIYEKINSGVHQQHVVKPQLRVFVLLVTSQWCWCEPHVF